VLCNVRKRKSLKDYKTSLGYVELNEETIRANLTGRLNNTIRDTKGKDLLVFMR
jgi:hypothetical protein